MKKIDLEVHVPLAVLDDEICDPPFTAKQHTMANTPGEHSTPTRNFPDNLIDLLNDLDCENNNNNPVTSSPSINGSEDSSSTSDETLSGSLEDLVSHFEEKLASCLKNFAETTETLAPVQIRSQDEIMSESQIWLTLTGNFGNILPIDWSKTYTRQLQLPALHTATNNNDNKVDDSVYNSCCSEDVAHDDETLLSEAMDLHRMVSRHNDWEPPTQSAEEVIEEIDEIIMQQSMNSSGFNDSDCVMDTSLDSACSALRSPSSYLNQYGFHGNCTALATQYGGTTEAELCYDAEDRMAVARRATANIENLSKMSFKQLTALKLELESLVDAYNEQLVQELATRDELECDKEAKNTFITLLLNVQSKRRQYHQALVASKRRGSKSFHIQQQQQNLPQYLTAVIPYDQHSCKSLDSRSLQALIKILRAINDNNPDVPAMLTDYILNVLCPSTNAPIIC